MDKDEICRRILAAIATDLPWHLFGKLPESVDMTFHYDGAPMTKLTVEVR